MTNTRGGSGAAAETGERYWRRWISHAFRTVRDWFQLHIGVLLATLLGPTVGNFAYAYFTADPADFDLATQALRSLLVGLAGTAFLFVVAFLIQLLLTPAALERSAALAAKQRIDALKHDLADARATVDRQHIEMDTTRLHEIEIAQEGPDLVPIDTSDGARDAWLAEDKNRYVAGYKAKVAEEERQKHPLFGLSLMSPFDRESRSGEEFVEELKAYFEALETRWVEALRTATIAREVAHLRLAVRNPTDVSVEGLEIQVMLPSDVGAGWEEDAEFDREMPARPKMWGRDTIVAFMPNLRSASARADPGRIERVDGRLVVTWDRFDLSGLARRPLAPVALFVPGDYAGRTLPVEWSASARRLRGVLAHSFGVAVSPASIAPAEVLHDRDER